MTRHVEVNDTWTFDTESVAAGFDHHVREQLPWYELVTTAVAQIARHYVTDGGLIYDVGASNGNMGRALSQLIDERHAALVAIEPSAAMASTYHGPGTVIVDSAERIEFEPHDFSVAMLALMFVKPSNVEQLLTNITSKLNVGGALVVVERMIPVSGYLSIVQSRLTLAAKRLAGATADEIIEKELSLSGVQRPISRELLESFGAVEFFRYGDFAGWIIEQRRAVS